jgi:hypothetical protein
MSTGNEQNQLLCICLNVNKDAKESFIPILRWIDDNQGDAKLLEAAVTYRYICNMTPLHWILREHPPVEIVEKMTGIAPMILLMKDNYGMLPLHVACRSGASLEVLLFIVKSYPESVTDVDDNGRIPLHHACDKGALPEVLKLLLEAWPQSLDVKDCYEKTPLDYASTDIVLLLRDAQYEMKEGSAAQLHRVHAQVIKKSLRLLSHHIRCGVRIKTRVSTVEGSQEV